MRGINASTDENRNIQQKVSRQIDPENLLSLQGRGTTIIKRAAPGKPRVLPVFCDKPNKTH
jgi:hypothetical protein